MTLALYLPALARILVSIRFMLPQYSNLSPVRIPSLYHTFPSRSMMRATKWKSSKYTIPHSLYSCSWWGNLILLSKIGIALAMKLIKLGGSSYCVYCTISLVVYQDEWIHRNITGNITRERKPVVGSNANEGPVSSSGSFIFTQMVLWYHTAKDVRHYHCFLG